MRAGDSLNYALDQRNQDEGTIGSWMSTPLRDESVSLWAEKSPKPRDIRHCMTGTSCFTS